MNQPWVIGLLGISFLAGTVGSYLWYKILGVLLKPKEDADWSERWITGVLTGIVERIFFTIAIATDVPDVGGAMLIWITLKTQSHYKIFSAERADGVKPDVPRLYRALLSNLGSLAFAMWGGTVWKQGVHF